MALKGWAGKILRVDLTTGNIKIENVEKYKAYLGGAGIGYKVMFDEVPQGTKALSAGNKVVFGVGPLTGAGAPLSGRTNVTMLCPTNPLGLAVDGHMGGNFGVMMKFAGYDAIIIEGASSKPVWLKIVNDKVSLEDASKVWGKGTYDTAYELNKIMGKEACIGCIGTAGENQLPSTGFINSFDHNAGGGSGAVLGYKKLKAIGIYGDQPVYVEKPQEFLELTRFMLSDILGANNQMVMPKNPEPWAEYTGSGSRWTGSKGVTWGSSDTAFDIGYCDPKKINKVGYRTQKAIFDLGAVAEARTIKMDGCHSCPIRCHSQLKMPELEKYGVGSVGTSTCVGYSNTRTFMSAASSGVVKSGTELNMVCCTLGARLCDDYGIWHNYGQLGKDFAYCYKKGVFKEVLPPAEYAAIPWDKLEAGDPAFLADIYKRMADNNSEFAYVGHGSANWLPRWQSKVKAFDLTKNYKDDYDTASCWNAKMSFPKHHSTESAAQVGGLINVIWNRDPNNHSHQNFIGSQLPYDIQKEIAEEIWGVGCYDAPSNYTRMNANKAKMVKWCVDRNMLHDSLTLCNWTWPMTVSPLKSRKYRGDLALEAKFLSAVTGEATSEKELDLIGERITTLHRAMTVLEMGTIDMRNEHDEIPPWAFDHYPDKPKFTPGNTDMDKEDMQLALTMMYREYGWDEKTGAPTKSTLVRLGMSDVAAKLEQLNLLPK